MLVIKSLHSNLYIYLQNVQGYLSPAIAVLFVMGVFLETRHGSRRPVVLRQSACSAVSPVSPRTSSCETTPIGGQAQRQISTTA